MLARGRRAASAGRLHGSSSLLVVDSSPSRRGTTASDDGSRPSRRSHRADPAARVASAPRQWPAAGSTSSTSTPPASLGWMKLIRESAVPRLGASYSRRTPRSRRIARDLLDVGDPVGELLEPRAGAVEELRDRGALVERGEQLDAGAGVADGDHRLAHALLLVGLLVGDLHPEACRGRASMAASRSGTAMPTWSMQVNRWAGRSRGCGAVMRASSPSGRCDASTGCDRAVHLAARTPLLLRASAG